MSVSYYDTDVTGGHDRHDLSQIVAQLAESLESLTREIAQALTDEGREQFMNEFRVAIQQCADTGSVDHVRITLETWSRAAAIMSTKEGQAAVSYALDHEDAHEPVDVDVLLAR